MELEEEQSAVRKERQTQSDILTIRQIIDKLILDSLTGDRNITHPREVNNHSKELGWRKIC